MGKLYDANNRIDEKNRINYFNNAKFLLIILVVVGHMMSCIKALDYTAMQIDVFIYSFHMPAFIVLSGYFSKNCVKSWNKTLTHVFSYFGTYLAAQIVFDSIQRYLLHSVHKPFDLFSPRVGLWYLLVLSAWTLLLKPLSKISPKILFPILIICGILVGLWNGAGKQFALSRMIVFLPFFMMGYYLDCGWIEKLHTNQFRIGGTMIMIFNAIICGAIASMKYLNLFMGNSSYMRMEMSYANGITSRLLWYILSTITVFAFLLLIPRGKIFFTHLGNRTMQVFILHSIICRALFVTDALDGVYEKTNLFFIFCLSLVLVFLLSDHRLSKLVAWPQKLVYNIKGKILAS